MIWEWLRTPPKFGTKLPGPEGPGFPLSNKSYLERLPIVKKVADLLRFFNTMISKTLETKYLLYSYIFLHLYCQAISLRRAKEIHVKG